MLAPSQIALDRTAVERASNLFLRKSKTCATYSPIR